MKKLKNGRRKVKINLKEMGIERGGGEDEIMRDCAWKLFNMAF